MPCTAAAAAGTRRLRGRILLLTSLNLLLSFLWPSKLFCVSITFFLSAWDFLQLTLFFLRPKYAKKSAHKRRPTDPSVSAKPSPAAIPPTPTASAPTRSASAVPSHSQNVINLEEDERHTDTIMGDQQDWVDSQLHGGHETEMTSEPRAEALANDALVQAEKSKGKEKQAETAYVPPRLTPEKLKENEAIVAHLYEEIWGEPDRQVDIIRKFKDRTSMFFDEQISLQKVISAIPSSPRGPRRNPDRVRLGPLRVTTRF